MRIYNLCICFILLFSYPLLAQQNDVEGDNYYQVKHIDRLKMQAGIALNMGKAQQRVGITLKIFYIKNPVQIGTGIDAYFNQKNWGLTKNYVELVVHNHIALNWGEFRDAENRIWNYNENLGNRKNYIGYTHNMYLNKIGTMQYTGTISFGGEHWLVSSENDIFGAPVYDRYRTAAIKAQYCDTTLRLGLSAILWTGGKGKRVRDKDYPSRQGYMDMTGVPYGLTSNGILAIEAQYATILNQYIGGQIGIDHEKVRHFLQNRLMHDMFLLPRKFSNKHNVHLPMISSQGEMFLYKEGQKVRPGKFYWSANTNSSVFY